MDNCTKNPLGTLADPHCWHFSCISKAIMLGKTVHEPEKLISLCCWCGKQRSEELPDRNGDPAVTHGPFSGVDLMNPMGFRPPG